MNGGISIAVFQQFDLVALEAQAAQTELTGDRVARARELSATGRCFTVRDADRRVIMCAGAVEAHPDYATLWAALSPAAGRHMTGITRRVRHFADMLPHRRIDAQVRVSHTAGRRWLALIGFVEEAVVPDLFEDGEDAMFYRYRRVG